MPRESFKVLDAFGARDRLQWVLGRFLFLLQRQCGGGSFAFPSLTIQCVASAMLAQSRSLTPEEAANSDVAEATEEAAAADEEKPGDAEA